MIRLYRCVHHYALEKGAMLNRSKCFHQGEHSHYHENTIKYSYNLALHPGNMYEGLANI